MQIYLTDGELKTVDTNDITRVDIIRNKKHVNDYAVYISDNFGRYRFYSISYALHYSKTECINNLKENLIKEFYIPEDKIRIS